MNTDEFMLPMDMDVPSSPTPPSGEFSDAVVDPFEDADAEADAEAEFGVEGETSGIFDPAAAAEGAAGTSGTKTEGEDDGHADVNDARLSPPTTSESNSNGTNSNASDDASIHLLEEVAEADTDNITTNDTSEIAAETAVAKEEVEADYTTEAGARAAVLNLVSANQNQSQVQHQQTQGQGQTQGQVQPARVSELTNSVTSASSLFGSDGNHGSHTTVTESILAGVPSNSNSSTFANQRPSFHDSIGSLGMSTLDLEARLGGPPTPELPGTASLSVLPDQMMMATMQGDGVDGSQGMANKRQRTAYDDNTDIGTTGMSRLLPNLTGFESTANTKTTKDKKQSSNASKKKRGSAKPPHPSQIIQTPEPSDVLFGRGGGTNVHKGNKTFRELINAHRRSYLKARKNDKPTITQKILDQIRQNHGGRFLKKAPTANGGGGGGGGGGKKKKKGTAQEGQEDEDVHDSVVGTGWYEVDDITAKEKISQALRQRAPELKKLIFKDQLCTEEIDYGQGNVVPVIFHPNPAENAYLRSLSVGLFSGGTEQVGQSHHAIEEAAKRRRMEQQKAGVADALPPLPNAKSQSQTPVPSVAQQQMLAQMQQVQMHLNQTITVGQQQGLMAGDVSGAAPTMPAQNNNNIPNAASLVQSLGAAAFEPIPYSGIDFAILSQEQERKIKLIEIQRLRLQKQQLELQIAQQKQKNMANMAGLAPMPVALDAFGAGTGGILPPSVGGGGISFPTGEMMGGGGPTTNAQLAQNEAEGATPPSSLLSAMASTQNKLSGSNGGSPQIALAPANGSGGTTPQYTPFGSMQA